MAIELKGGLGKSVCKDLVVNHCKEVVQATRKTNSSRRNHKKPLVWKQKVILIRSIEGFEKADPTEVGDDRVDVQCGRSFADLPDALVCEILTCLDAKELGIVSCVSTLLNSLVLNHHGWKKFYCDRWGLPCISSTFKGPAAAASGPADRTQTQWKGLFVDREFRSNSFLGRYSLDVLRGHDDAVRAVFILPSAKLIFTGGYDRVVRMWDMEEGFSIAVSRSLGCTIRAIAADRELLVAAGTDAFIQCWRAIDGHPQSFDITGNGTNQNAEFRLWGHEGPITCLALDSMRIFSGSWDMSIRIWDRAHMKCLGTLRHGDWVWAIQPRGSTVASTSGRDAYIWDIDSGELITVLLNTSAGKAQSLARTHLGKLLFIGGEDGSINMYEYSECGDGCSASPAATWRPHTGPVSSLAFEYPWLVSSSSDGRISLIDLRKHVMARRHVSSRQDFKVKRSPPGSVESPQRILQGGCTLYSVDIGADRIVCGGEEGVVKLWDFSEALEIEKKVQAMRSARIENRMRRRKAQLEMNGIGARADPPKRNPLNSDRAGIWHSKRGVSGKLKA